MEAIAVEPATLRDPLEGVTFIIRRDPVLYVAIRKDYRGVVRGTASAYRFSKLLPDDSRIVGIVDEDGGASAWRILPDGTKLGLSIYLYSADPLVI